jgi:hypothetical protein
LDWAEIPTRHGFALEPAPLPSIAGLILPDSGLLLLARSRRPITGTSVNSSVVRLRGVRRSRVAGASAADEPEPRRSVPSGLSWHRHCGRAGEAEERRNPSVATSACAQGNTLRVPPRVLLDTNVWRRLSDAEAIEPLRMRAKASKVHILVAPAVVYEMLRTPGPELRARQVKAVTLRSWKRLMTESFEECRDVREAIRRHRPEWLRSRPDLASFYRSRANWAGARGFWHRARHDTAGEAARLASLEGDEIRLARAQAQARRADLKSLHFDSMVLTGWTGRPIRPVPGWDGTDVDAWRLDSVQSWSRSLALGRQHPALDWLGPFVDLRRIAEERRSWNHLWLHEVDVKELPLEWMRWAVSVLQGVRKVTPGTPGDNQLSVYCYEADLLVSADKAFVEIINRVRQDAPAPVAEARLVRRGEDPLKRIVSMWT